MTVKPIFSFVMWLDRPDVDLWAAAISSVKDQIYDRFELLIVVSPATSGTIVTRVREAADRDARIRVLPGKFHCLATGFDAAVNRCAGDFIGILGEHDVLERSATLEFALHLKKFPDARILFSDEDQLDASGIYHSPVLKNAWDPEAIIYRNTIGRLLMLSAAEIKDSQKMCLEAGRFSEYDLIIRLAWKMKAGAIQHIPSVLYHNQHVTTGRKAKILFRELINNPRRRIITQNLKEKGNDDFVLSFPKNSTSARIKFGLPQNIPLVSIIIPTRDKADILRKCMNGLLNNTSYSTIEIIIVDNNSQETKTADYLKSLADYKHIRILNFDGDFNWSAINNVAAKEASGDILLFLNNDTEVIAENWLQEIVSHVVRPEIGIVGIKLLYPDMRVQHAGIVFSPQGGIHNMRHAAYDDPGYLDELSTVRSVSAVTGACMAIRKSTFNEIDGFEERNLRVTWSDVDLCLRAGAKGYRTIWTPWAVLIHHEVVTRGADETPEKIARSKREHDYMKETWGELVTCDHFQNPNLAPSEEVQKLAIPSRKLKNFAAAVHSGHVG